MRDQPVRNSRTSLSRTVLAATAGAATLGWALTSRQLMRERTDDITGLPTRRRFLATFQRRLRWHRGNVRVVLLDLNGFKTVNDVYGHEAGNLVLWHTAQRLTAALPTRLVAATRLGGDEFAALIQQPHCEDIGLISRALSSPVSLSSRAAVSTSASVGGVIVSRRSGATVSSALRAADKQMYLSKNTSCCRRRPEPQPRGPVRMPRHQNIQAASRQPAP